ncbi:DUF4442 domain-containing protein [Pseudomonas cavernicola]|uniref:DUF4442 domain-containing protein n=1 Tax=Pseudomonas cavernicola TaxID=2320866 RepID=UPI002367750D|nr:DUF4442 domain-containing protein [Pseudomonas cavernicola]
MFADKSAPTEVDYQKRASGALQAIASLSSEQIQAIRTQDKGEVTVAVSVTDETGIQPIQCEMVWAWVSKKR